MRVKCNFCGSKANILVTEPESADFVKLRCQCTNVDCGHRFVSLLTFSHSTTPPLKQLQRSLIDAAIAALKDLSKEEKRIIIEQIMA